MIFLAQMPAEPQLPPLPKGPSLDRVRGPIEISAYEPWQIAILLGLIVLLTSLLIWLYVRSRRKSATATSPYEVAVAELQAATDLTPEDDERFAMLSSQALRRYLEDELGLHSTACTSKEFLLRLRDNTQVDEFFQTTLREVLDKFDQIKFAQQPISMTERICIIDTVRELINQAHVASQMKGARP